MFFNSINQFIETLSHSKFIDDQISVKVDECIRLFFCSSARFDSPLGKLILKRNATNSIGDEVNPKFIEKLKTTTTSLLNILAINWSEDKREGSTLSICRSLKESEKIRCLSSVLLEIDELYNPEKKWSIELRITREFLYIKAEEVEVLQFSRILRWEAIQTRSATVQAIHLLMCAKNSGECFSSIHVPKELIKKIVELISLLLFPNPIQNLK